MDQPCIDLLVDQLRQRDWAMAEGALASPSCQALCKEIQLLSHENKLAAAGVGRGVNRQVLTEIRSDFIHWLDESQLSEAQCRVWALFETLRLTLNRRLFLGLKSFEAHLAYYPPGGKYSKHVDNFQGQNHRVLSTILYLNEDWHEACGGALRLYNEKHQPVVDIPPKAGTLACFLSRDTPHEVLPTSAARYSVTGWFLDGVVEK